MDMTMESCRTFVEVLASNAPAPGGGGAAALVGAIGTALGNMVGSLTVGKKKYADVQDEILALKARVRALLRRASIAAAPEQSSASTLKAGHITVDEQRRSAMKNGVEVELTMKEFDLILFLMKNPGKVFSRESLLNLVWGYDYQGDTRTVDVHIRRLREKLELTPAQPQYIITKWGVGYYFAG